MVAQQQTALDPWATYEEVKSAMARWVADDQGEDDNIKPAVLPMTSKYLFRTIPNRVLMLQISLDMPDPSWIHPQNVYGPQMLANYEERTNWVIPGHPDLTWGKLNRIVARKHGSSTITFTSLPRTKESYFRTDDDYVALLIRMKMALGQGDMVFVKEEVAARKIYVGGMPFDDTSEGRTAAFMYATRMGIQEIKLDFGDDETMPELVSVPLPSDNTMNRVDEDLLARMRETDHFYKSFAAGNLHKADLADMSEPLPPSDDPGLLGVMFSPDMQAAIEFEVQRRMSEMGPQDAEAASKLFATADPGEVDDPPVGDAPLPKKRGRGKLKLADPLDIFKAQMEANPRVDMSDTLTEASYGPTEDPVVDIDNSGIEELIEEVAQTYGGSNEAGGNDSDSNEAGGLPPDDSY